MFGIILAIVCAALLVRLWRRPYYGRHAYGYHGRPGPCSGPGHWRRGGPWRDDMPPGRSDVAYPSTTQL